MFCSSSLKLQGIIVKLSSEYLKLQVLVTKPDFYNEETRRYLFGTLSELISLNIVPIINTNDAVTPPPQINEEVVVKGSVKVSNYGLISLIWQYPLNKFSAFTNQYTPFYRYQ